MALQKTITILMLKIQILILFIITLFSCGINQPLEHYPLDDDDVVFVKPKQGDLIVYAAIFVDDSEQSLTGSISIERTSSIEIIPGLDEQPELLLEEATNISGFNQMKNDIRVKHIATSDSGALYLYAVETRNGELYYLREPGTENIGVEILPNSVNELDSTFSARYDIEKCPQLINCTLVGSYIIKIQKIGIDSEVTTPSGIFGTFQISTTRQVIINDEEYNINYSFKETGLINPPIGLVEFSLVFNDLSNIESNTSITIFAEVTQIELPEIVNAE